MRAATRMRPLLRFLSSWLPVILWAALILSAANDQFSDEQTAGWLDRLFGSAPRIVNVTVRKGGHVVAYAVLALLAWRARPRLVAAMLIVLAVAITDESMQAMTYTREGSPYDVLLDACGGLLALALSRSRVFHRPPARS
jgi:VanZ family protein